MTPVKPEFLDLIRSGQRFLLSGHEHPDGDCVGSQVALFHLIRALGGEPRICNPDPVSQSLEFLSRHTPIGSFRQEPRVPEFDVAVLLDCATLSRLGNLGDLLRDRAKPIAVIDHHVGSEAGDGVAHYVDVSAAATGVLVFDLYKALEVPIPPPAAEAMFVAIVADTGWFKYSNADARTLAIASELVGLGACPDALYDRMYRDHDPRSIGILSDGLSGHQSRLGGRFGYTVLAPELMDRISRAGFDTDHILEPIRSVLGVEVAGVFKVVGQNQTKMSLRAMGDVDVQKIASSLGGGGHKKAAGATMNLTVGQAIDAVEEQVRVALEGD